MKGFPLGPMKFMVVPGSYEQVLTITVKTAAKLGAP